MEFQCRDIVQRAYPSRGSPVENIPLQAERDSGVRQKLFIFTPELVFTFRPECRSESQRNGVQLQTGIAFIFDRIPQPAAADVGDYWSSVSGAVAEALRSTGGPRTMSQSLDAVLGG